MQTLMHVIARLYDQVVDCSDNPEGNTERRAWTNLAVESAELASQIRRTHQVVESADSQPHATARAVFADIARGHFVVSTANCVHPLWTPEQNVDFRIVHDVLGHYDAHLSGRVADFSWEGEVNACAAHETHVFSILARRAILTECLGQAAYALTYGHFGTQKVGLL